MTKKAVRISKEMLAQTIHGAILETGNIHNDNEIYEVILNMEHSHILMMVDNANVEVVNLGDANE